MSVSVLLCCHNSTSRLEPTLRHLLAQTGCDGIPWEIVIVDNASSDGTAEFATRLLEGARIPWKVVPEPTPGRAQALLTGFQHCAHEFISTIDDDNWVASNWIERAEHLMTSDPGITLAGSLNEAVFETTAPAWFSAVAGSYACGPHASEASDVTERIGFLPGAGATFRKAAVLELLKQGFYFFTTTLRGKRGGSGEDVELGFALSAAGGRIYYTPELRLQHFMPASRMTWPAALKHAGAVGAGALGIDPYLLSRPPGPPARAIDRWRRTWLWQAVSKSRAVLSYGARLLPSRRQREGDLEVLELERKLGALRKILAERGRYTKHMRMIADAPWRTHR